MSRKCDFCKFDMRVKTEQCRRCHDHSAFEPKVNMTEAMAHDYRKYIEKETWANDHSIQYDRDTALEVLKAITRNMYPSYGLFGTPTLVINRDDFEFIRKKFLD